MLDAVHLNRNLLDSKANSQGPNKSSLFVGVDVDFNRTNVDFNHTSCSIHTNSWVDCSIHTNSEAIVVLGGATLASNVVLPNDDRATAPNDDRATVPNVDRATVPNDDRSMLGSNVDRSMYWRSNDNRVVLPNDNRSMYRRSNDRGVLLAVALMVTVALMVNAADRDSIEYEPYVNN